MEKRGGTLSSHPREPVQICLIRVPTHKSGKGIEGATYDQIDLALGTPWQASPSSALSPSLSITSGLCNVYSSMEKRPELEKVHTLNTMCTFGTAGFQAIPPFGTPAGILDKGSRRTKRGRGEVNSLDTMYTF